MSKITEPEPAATIKPPAATAKKAKLKIKSLLTPLKGATVPLVWAMTDEDQRFFADECKSLFSHRYAQNVYRYSDARVLQESFASGAPAREAQEATGQGFAAVINWFLRVAPDDYRDDENSLPPLSDKSFAGRDSVLFLYDFPAYVEHSNGSRHSSPSLTRLLKDGVDKLLAASKTVVIVSHHLNVPEELEHEVVLVEHPRPGDAHLAQLVRDARYHFQNQVDVKMEDGSIRVELDGEMPDMDAAAIEGVVDLVRGMTFREVENVLVRAVTENKGRRHAGEAVPIEFDRPTILKERIKSVRKNSELDILEPAGGLELLGGMPEVKDWLRAERPFFDGAGAAEGINPPKGIVLVGPGGTGKTHGANCIAHYLKRPLIRWDIGGTKGGIVGQTEANMRRVIRALKSQGKIVCFVDEFGKIFPNARGGAGASLDSGVGMGQYATLIQLMQENDGQIFFVFACNDDILNIPAPALRAGRIDKVFYTPLPSAAERADVARIHMTKRGWDEPELLALPGNPDFAQATHEYTPAEIEQVMIRALKLKFTESGPRPALPTLDHLLRAAKATTPMARTHRAEIDAIEAWAVDNGHYQRPVAAPVATTASGTPARVLPRSRVNLASHVDDEE